MAIAKKKVSNESLQQEQACLRADIRELRADIIELRRDLDELKGLMDEHIDSFHPGEPEADESE